MNSDSGKRLLVTLSLLVVAFLCYIIGYGPGSWAFFLVGGGFETAFWIRILSSRYKSKQRLQALHQSGENSNLLG
jgi:hypothetical protein